MKANKILRQRLNEVHAVLIRNNRHEVWQLPNGMKVTFSRTPSDRRALENQLRDINRAMGASHGV